jgi:hypothetical protein
MSVCLSIRMEQLGPQLTDFREIWYFTIFHKSVEKIQVSLKYDKNSKNTQPLKYFYDNIELSFFRMKNISDKICRESKKAPFMFNNCLNRAFYHICGKIWYSRKSHRWQYNAANALYMMHNWGYKHTFRTCKFTAFPWQRWLRERASMLRIYVHCLPVWDPDGGGSCRKILRQTIWGRGREDRSYTILISAVLKAQILLPKHIYLNPL